jgi:hypothetical protein
MTARSILVSLAACLVLSAGVATAQPAPPAPPRPPQPPSGDKVDAKSLMQSGVRLLEAKDYLGALAVFKDAYQRFPSAKILLNIGTTYKLLYRPADAANAYQRYLDASDADPARRGEVNEALADLDKVVGRIELAVTPADAEVQFTDDWVPASAAKLWRVTAGAFTIHARRDGYKPLTKTASIVGGDKAAVVIALELIPKEKPLIVTVPVERQVVPEGPRSRFGATAAIHMSVLPRVGSAVFIGGTADLTEQLGVDVALVLGPGLVSSGMTDIAPPSWGGYLGATFAFLPGKLRPRASAGMPIFSSNGARFALRAAGGIEYVANNHVAVTLDLGAEYNLNPENDIHTIAFVPALGVSGRI